jgi:hypothetical protein
MRPSVRDLTTCLIAVINDLGVEVYLLGDAFDECSEWNRLWYFMTTVVQSSCPALHFLFTARPEQSIQDAVAALGIPTVDLQCTGIDEDIENYIQAVVQEDPRFSHISDEGKILIKDSLITRANRMCVGPHDLIPDYLINLCVKVPLGCSADSFRFPLLYNVCTHQCLIRHSSHFG